MKLIRGIHKKVFYCFNNTINKYEYVFSNIYYNRCSCYEQQHLSIMETLKLSLRLISLPQSQFSSYTARLSTTLVLFLTLIDSTSYAQITRSWDGGGTDNNWSTVGNWSSDNVPDGTGEAAMFTDDPIGQTKLTPNLSANVTIGQLQFSATAPSYTITGSGASILYLGPAASYGGVGVTIANGAANQTISAAEVYFLSSQSWDIGGTTTLTVSGTIEDAPSPDYALTKNGTGALVFPGDVRYDGPTTVNAGKLVLSFSNTSMLSALTVNDGILRATTNANALGNNAVRNTVTLAGGALELANNTDLAFGPSTRKTTVSGNTTIRSDRLTNGVGVTHTLGTLSIGAQTLSVAAGAFVNIGTAGIVFGATTLSGNATFDVVSSSIADAQLTLGAVGQSGGARSLTKTGSGTLLLNGAGHYTGATTLNQGTIMLGVANALGSGGFIFAGGTLNANNVTDNSIGALMLTASSTLNLSPGDASATLTFAGISGDANGILTINGWSGVAGGLGSNDKIVFSGGTLPDADFLQHIYFDLGDGNIYDAALDDSGELFASLISPSLIVIAKIFLEGPYNGSSMNTLLNPHLPNTQPYNVSPWNYQSLESVESGFFASHTDIVDWILLEIKNSSLVTVGTRAAFLKSNGTIVDLDGTSPVEFKGVPDGNYYIVIRHRNHLSVMSMNMETLSSTSSIYDFTTGLSRFYNGDAVDLGGGVYGMYAGDANGDGQVTTLDYDAWLPNARSSVGGYSNTDMNLDGQNTTLDYDVWLPNARTAKISQVP